MGNPNQNTNTFGRGPSGVSGYYNPNAGVVPPLRQPQQQPPIQTFRAQEPPPKGKGGKPQTENREFVGPLVGGQGNLPSNGPSQATRISANNPPPATGGIQVARGGSPIIGQPIGQPAGVSGVVRGGNQQIGQPIGGGIQVSQPGAAVVGQPMGRAIPPVQSTQPIPPPQNSNQNPPQRDQNFRYNRS